MYRWLAAQNRTERKRNELRYELISPTNLSSVIEPTSSVDKLTRPPGAENSLIGSHEGGSAKLTQISARNLAELHLEFRPLPRTKRFGVAFVDGQNPDAVNGPLIDIKIDDLSCGGLFSLPQRVCIYPSSPITEYSIRSDTWNDLRIKIDRDRISAELNGLILLDDVAFAPLVADEFVAFVAEGHAGSQVEIQNVRIRRVGHADSESATPKLDPTATPIQNRESDAVVRDSIEIASIEAAWKRREEIFSHVEIRWTDGSDGSRATTFFRSSEGTGSDLMKPNISKLSVSPNTIQVSTNWRHSRVDFSRKAGLKDTSNQQDFLRAFKSKFVANPDQSARFFRLDIHCDEKCRIDSVFDAGGHGIRGIIFKKPIVWYDRISEIDDAYWRGALIAFRPLSNYGIAIDLNSCEILPGATWVDAARCLVVEERTSVAATKIARRFWVDPHRDFLVLRASVSVDEVLREQVDVHYAQNSAQRWLPVSWSAIAQPILGKSPSDRTFAGIEWLYKVESAKVIECRVGESSSSPAIFSGFREGTLVFDQTTNEWTQQLGYGKKRTLSAREVTTFSVDETAPRRNLSWLLLIILIGGLLFPTVWLAIRRFRRRS
jgi:hypothetical protein